MRNKVAKAIKRETMLKNEGAKPTLGYSLPKTNESKVEYTQAKQKYLTLNHIQRGAYNHS